MKRDLPMPQFDVAVQPTGATTQCPPRRLAASRDGKPLPALSKAHREAMRQDWNYFEVQLFARLAEECSQLLNGPWELVLGLVRQQPRYWVYPTASIGQIESDPGLDLQPFIDVDALARDWPALKQRVWLAC
jgi:hypothetical protein